jgi:hypothetical protein
MASVKSDLTSKEQASVRIAILFLRARCGGWVPLGKLLRLKDTTLSNVARKEPVSASLAFRVARLARVGIDDLLAGKYPPTGACPHCGHVKESTAVDEETAQK